MIVKQINHMTDSETDFEVSNPQQFEEVFGEPLENRNLYEATLLLCEQRSNHHLDYTVSGDPSAQQPNPLSKSTGLPRFPGLLGPDFKPETDVSSSNTTRQRKLYALKAAQSLKGLPKEHYKNEVKAIKEDITPISKKQAQANVAAGWTLTPEQQRTKGLTCKTPGCLPTATVVNEGLSPDSRAREHEAIHHSLYTIGHHYGDDTQDRVQNHLANLIHPKVTNILSKYLSTNPSYTSGEHHKEVIPHLFEMLNDPLARKHILDMAEIPEADRNEVMGFAKRSWKRILRTSQLFTPESLRIPKKS